MAGTWRSLLNPPSFNASTMLLLTDGRIMCQQAGGVNWYILTPDANGDYTRGTWTTAAPMHHTRLYYASAVLADGRVIVVGGEYSDAGDDTNTGELYDPGSDTWTVLAPPPGWAQVGDAACCVLPDGRFLMGNLIDRRTAIFDPAIGSWSAGPTKGDTASEETWTLLPDNTILAPQCQNHPHAEKYVISTNTWVSAGTVPVDLVEAASIEIGPAFLMPDGRTFCVGATAHTALYTMPAAPASPGTWAAGPDIPRVGADPIGAKDAPGCLMPNGKVLFVGGPVDGIKDSYKGPTYFYEFDGVNIYRVPDPANAGGLPYNGRMLLLPTGQVLFAAGTAEMYYYTPDGAPQDAWRPTITSLPASLRSGGAYTLQGTLLNGLSQAVGYGDDASSATNYPLVRLRHIATGAVTYCTTYDHSTMAVNTGGTVQSTNFVVPLTAPLGDHELFVVANGISSAAQRVSLLPRLDIISQKYEMWNWLIGSLADGPLWVWGPNGPVPVDPYRIIDKSLVKNARKQMLQAMKLLQLTGKKVESLRAKAAKAIPPAVDKEAAEANGKEAKAKPVIKTKKTKAKPAVRTKPKKAAAKKRSSRK